MAPWGNDNVRFRFAKLLPCWGRLALFSLITLATCSVLAGGVDLSRAQLQVVGAYVNGANGRDIDLYRLDNQLWFPLETLVELTGMKLDSEGEQLQLLTPLGAAPLPPQDLASMDGELFIRARDLSRLVHIESLFDQQKFAIRLDVPWDSGAMLVAGAPGGAKLVADVAAPDSSISMLRSRSSYRRNLDTHVDDYNITLDAGGRAGPGTWLLGVQDDQRRDARLNRYFWNQQMEQSVYRLGTNFINLSPLLDNVDYTGAQAAWSNSDISRYTDFASDLNFDSFLAEDITNQQNIIRTDGPPGGLAELRINDNPLARVRVDLQGNYEFRNLPSLQGDFQKVEIYLYQRSLLENPVAIVDYTRQVVREMLPEGETLLRAGVGTVGNPLDEEADRETGDPLAFIQARHALYDKLTLQGVVQQGLDDSYTAVAGFRASAARNWAMAFDYSNRDGVSGYNTELLGSGARWDFNLRSRYFGAGYRSTDNPDQSRHENVLRAFFLAQDTLRIGAVGRSYRSQTGTEINFLKPAAYWNVSRDLYLSAVPNLDGEYRASADYYYQHQHRFTALYDNDVYSVLHNYNHDSWSSLQTGYEYSEELGSGRVFTQVDYYFNESIYNQLQAGVSYNNDSPGFFVSWNRILRPGIEFEVSYEDQYRLFEGLDPGAQVFFSLRMDFAPVGGRLAPADNRYVNFSRGGIAGSIVDSSGKRLPFSNVGLKINGRRLPQFQSGGDYYVGGLKPGIYQIEIDETNLPLELVPVDRKMLVEVGQAAVTSVDFEVRAEYGIAGQITYAKGQAVASARVEAINEAGELAAVGITGQFGFYRIDGLIPGDYQLRVVRVGDQKLEPPLAERLVTVSDDYQFEQNLVVR